VSARIVRAAALVLLWSALPVGQAAADEQTVTFRGTARGRDGEVFYRELHQVRSQDGRPLTATTTYLDPGGQVIALLQTDFTRDPFAPSYRFEDRRRAEVEEVVVSADGVMLSAGGRQRTVPRSAEPSRPLVTGQGLERYVRHRLAELEGGAELPVTFAIPSRQEAYPFRVRATPPGRDPATVRVRVEIDSWVLRLFASSLDVEYDRATRRLLRYRGLSNLRDERGDNPEVVITYTYPDASAPDQELPRASL
jgi:hypothetical protein